MVSEAIPELSFETVEGIQDYTTYNDAVCRSEIWMPTAFHCYQAEVLRAAEEAEIGNPDTDIEDAEDCQCLDDSA